MASDLSITEKSLCGSDLQISKLLFHTLFVHRQLPLEIVTIVAKPKIRQITCKRHERGQGGMY